MKIGLFVLGKKGLESLKALASERRSSIHTVIIGTDAHVLNDYSQAIIEFCKEKDLAYNLTERIANCELLIAIGWRKLIQITDNQRLIVLHDSILPRYRGFNPLVTALINGDDEIGVTAIFGAESYDTGPIIDFEKITIEYPLRIGKAIDLLSVCYANLLNRVIDKLEKNNFEALDQDENKATYSLWRDAQDYYLNWEWNADKVQRHINAVSDPYKGAKCRNNDIEYTVLEATVLDDVVIENRTPGKVIFKEKGKLVVVCGEGLLRLDMVVDAEGKEVTFETNFRLRFE